MSKQQHSAGADAALRSALSDELLPGETRPPYRNCRRCADLRYAAVIEHIERGASISAAAEYARISRQSIYRHIAECQRYADRRKLAQRRAEYLNDPDADDLHDYSAADFVAASSARRQTRQQRAEQMKIKNAKIERHASIDARRDVRREQRQRIVAALRSGASRDAAALRAGVPPSTARQWRTRYPEFRAASEAAEQDASERRTAPQDAQPPK